MDTSLAKNKVVAVLMLSGIVLVVYRAAAGLGAVTALTDYQPWGLVKAVNIFTGAALAAGSFVIAAAAHIFRIKRLRPLVRPVLLMGFIGHSFVLIALLYDVGRPLNVWRIITNPQGHSALMWTAWCEVVYTSLMGLELLPDALKEGRHYNVKWLVKAIKGPLLIISAALAVVYQSTLGTLYLVSPHRVGALWYGPALPALFFLSAVAAGLGMVVIESYAADRSGRRKLDTGLMKPIAVMMGVTLALYLSLRLGDLFMGGLFTCVSPGCGGSEFLWFAAEVVLGAGLPLTLLLLKDFREGKRGLLIVSVLTVFGVLMNRLGVVIIGWSRPSGEGYFPSGLEFYAAFFFIFAAVVIYWRISLKFS